jgi:hypothetical protein
MLDAEAMLRAAKRPLVIGIGGGGDVVGALATAEACRLYNGADPLLGGVTWERRPIDPEPGPRAIEEIEGAIEIAGRVVAASADTRVRGSGVLFAESHMARTLGVHVILIDPTGGPGPVADGLAQAMEPLGADLLVFVDVGGDALGRGDEPGLASPLCDAVLLAAAAELQERGLPVLGGVFALGADGELTMDEIWLRLAEVAAAGGFAGARALTPPVAELLAQVVEEVPTEASAQALRCFRGEVGSAEIRQGRRTVPLSPAGAVTFYFDVVAALGSGATLAHHVRAAGSLDEANAILNALGVRTELDYEREMAASS